VNSKWTPGLVKDVQALLIFTGYDKSGRLNADGDLGEHTRNALLAFQAHEELEQTGELNEEVLQHMANHFFDPSAGGVDPIKRIQAAMFLEGFDSGGELIVDGVLGEHTQKMLPLLTAHYYVMNRSYCIDLPEADEKAPDGCRAETVDVPPNGEGERNRL